MSFRKSLSTPIKEKIVEGRKNGVQPQDLAKQFGCSTRTIRRLVNQSKASGNLHRASKSGRHPITTTGDDRLVIRNFKMSPDLTATDGGSLYKTLCGKTSLQGQSDDDFFKQNYSQD